MKIVVIGDIHGRSIWKQIIEQNLDADLFIFIGDYFDSFDISGIEQLLNFNEILEFKKNNIDKVILLLGNHDFHYMFGCIGVCNGFQYDKIFDFKKILEDAIYNNLIQIVYNYGKYLFSHAGVTKTWFNHTIANNQLLVKLGIEKKIEAINIFFKNNRQDFNLIYSYKDYNNSGNNIENGPLWVRPKALTNDALLGYTQIVGHTHSKEIYKINSIGGPLWFIDSLPNEYLVIENNEIQKRAL